MEPRCSRQMLQRSTRALSASIWSPLSGQIRTTLSSPDAMRLRPSGVKVTTSQAPLRPPVSMMSRHPATATKQARKLELTRRSRTLHTTPSRSSAAQQSGTVGLPKGEHTTLIVTRQGLGRAGRTWLTFQGVRNEDPAFSPDGQWLALVNNDGSGYRIALMDWKNPAHPMKVISDGSLDEHPRFAPNSQVVIYTTQGHSGEALRTAAVDGRVHQTLTQPGVQDVREPAWAPFPPNQ